MKFSQNFIITKSGLVAVLLLYFNTISADQALVIIPILVSIFVFPVLVIITICSIRIRNIKAREKRIKDWAKENKTLKSMKVKMK